MNERMRQLEKQADQYERKLGKGIGISRDERFAELIIKECLEVIEKQFGGGNGDGVEWDRAVEFTYNDVKQHFGVEE